LPKKLKARKGHFQLAITNNGNTVSTYKLEGSDPEDICDFRFKSDTVAVDPGTTKKTPVIVNPRKKPFTGASRSFGFSVKAMPLEGEPKEADGELDCRPLLPKWAVAAIVLGVVVLIALVVVLATRGDNLPPPPFDRNFDLAYAQKKVYPFKLELATTIKVDVTWGGGADGFSVVLRGPDGAVHAQDDGASPLSINHAVSDDDLVSGERWTVSVTNVSYNKGKGKNCHITVR
jgi:hypothetical protein